MTLRRRAGDMARTTSLLWRGVADVLDPSRGGATGARGETRARGDQGLESDSRPDDRGPDVDLREPGPPVVPDGGMLVPIDTWTRVLEQLANLHEAGRELAEARERAARAETEASFLREQLAEARKRTPARREREPVESIAVPAAAGAHVVPDRVLIRVRRRASDWLRPGA